MQTVWSLNCDFLSRKEQKKSLGAQLAVSEDDEVSIVDEIAGPSEPKVTLIFRHCSLSCSVTVTDIHSGETQNKEYQVPWPWTEERTSLHISQVEV